MHPSLISFFESEVADYRVNVRNGNLDPADGFHPTLGSALYTLKQWPERPNWLGLTDSLNPEFDDEVDAAIDILVEFASLIVEHGPEALLLDLLP